MNKRILLFFVIISMMMNVMAKPVDKNTASRVASTYLKAVTGKTYDNLTDITAQTPFHEFYVFTLGQKGGFILVSADDCVLPVLGYSEHDVFMTESMPAHVMDWLQDYEDQITFFRNRYGKESYGHSEEVEKQWQGLLNGRLVSSPQSTSVSPLLTTTWNQGTYYNNLCPSGTYTGCAATAMAQVMKYHNYPTVGYGSHSYADPPYGTLSANFGNTTYNWNSMPNSLSSSSSSAQVNAVATLMYHVGVAIEMEYGTDGSSANTYSLGDPTIASCENALYTYFKYKPSLRAVVLADFTNAEWCNMLKNELDASRPILYSGRDVDGGHAFVLDGYNNQNQFHVNWGWGGYCDGYYAIGSLNPSTGGAGGNTSGTYNLKNTAVIGIEPMSTWSTSATTTITANVSNSSYGSVTGSGTYQFADTVTLTASATSGNRFYGWTDGSTNVTRGFLATGGSYSFTANVGPLTGDTMSYCFNRNEAYFGSSAVSNIYWGIKLPASVLTAGATLNTVQAYFIEAGTYTLLVYTGGTSNPSTNVCTQTFNITTINQWVNLDLTTPLSITGTENLWIFLKNSDANYPVALSNGGGNNDGSRVAFANPTSGSLMTFGPSRANMIRAIFSGGSVPPCSSVTIPFEEGFESGELSSCWTTDGPGTWSVGVGDHESSTGTHSGNYNIKITHDADGNVTKLITPVFDFTGVSAAELHFWHIQRDWSDDQDILKVYYRTTPSGIWQLLESYTDEISTWTEDIITLPNLTATYQVAFEMTDHYGYGVALDDISITLPPSCSAVSGLSVSDVTTTSVTLEWSDPNNTGATYTVSDASGVIASGINTTTYTVTGLTPNTLYTFNVVANCSATESSYAANVNIRTLTAAIMCGNDTASTFANSNSISNTTVYFPGYSYYNYSYTEVIILADSLQGLSEVKGMEFYVNSLEAGSVEFNNCEIYLMNTTASVFNDGFIQDTNNLQLVYSGNLNQSAIGWKTITFDNSFQWDGSSNLLVAIRRNNGDYDDPGSFGSYTASANLACYDYRDNFPFIIGEITNSMATNNVPVYHMIGCGASYCEPTPTSVDNDGITSVSFGGMTNNTHPTTAAYADYSNLSGSVSAGTTASVAITYATGYTYGTIIWVDWNNNATFEGNEVVYVGTSLYNNPTTLTATFDIPATQAVGNYRMRILGADSYFDSYTGSIAAAANADPCATYSWGVAEDYTLTVTAAPSCLPVTGLTVTNVTNNSATLTWNGTGASGYIVYDMSNNSVIANTSNTTYTINNLSANTGYSFGVASNCGSSVSTVVTVNCQTTCDVINIPFAEGFENTSSTVDCWTSEGSGTWTIGTGDYTSATGAFEGSLNAKITHGSTGNVTKLISPALNQGNAAGVQLTFAHIQRSWAGDIDQLRVLYRSSVSSDWDTAATYTDAYNEWTVESLTLTGTVYQVAFEMTDGYGYGVAIDSVVFAIPQNYEPDSVLVYIAVNNATMGTTVPAPGTHMFYEGQTCSAVAVPNTGYHLQAWGLNVTYLGQTIIDDTVTTSVADAFTLLDSLRVVGPGYHNYVFNVKAFFAEDFVCMPVTNLSANAITYNSVTVNWTGSANSYSLYRNGSHIANVTTNSYTFSGLSASTSYTFGVTAVCSTTDSSAMVTVNATTASNQVTVTLTQNNATYGSVTGGGIYTIGDNVTVSATANTGYQFSRWAAANGSTVSTNNPYSFVASTDVTLNAVFTDIQIETYTVTATANNATMGYVTGGGVYSAGEVAVLTAIPNEGYHFVNWTCNGNNLGTNNPLSITVSSTSDDYPYIANFEVDTYTVTAVANDVTMGYVTGGGVYSTGEVAVLTAIPNEGYHFVNWTCNGNNLGTNNPLSITVSSTSDDYPYIANFDADSVPPVDQYLTLVTAVNDTAMGTMTPAPGSYQYSVGDMIHFTATPNEGYHVESVSILKSYEGMNPIDTTIYISNVSLLDMEVAQDMLGATFTYTVNFAATPSDEAVLNVTVNDGTLGYVLINGNRVSSYTGHIGDTVTLEAVANENCSFQNWSDGNTNASRSIVLQQSVTSISASFIRNEGVEEAGSLADLNVYPNPTFGVVNINADNVVKVEVIDINGRQVCAFENVNSFDISNLSVGTYMLRIQTTSGVTLRRVVKK